MAQPDWLEALSLRIFHFFHYAQSSFCYIFCIADIRTQAGITIIITIILLIVIYDYIGHFIHLKCHESFIV